MPRFALFPQFVALDAVDLSLGRAAQRGHLDASLPALRRRLDAARDHYLGTITGPESAAAIADDTWGDPRGDRCDTTAGTGRVVDAERAHMAAVTELEMLERDRDPVTFAAAGVLGHAYRQLTELGLGSAAAREAAVPRHGCGLSVPVLVWEARNQHELWPDPRPLPLPTAAYLRTAMRHAPALFGLADPPDDGTMGRLGRQRSWAPEALRLLGWTTSEAAAAGLEQLRVVAGVGSRC